MHVLSFVLATAIPFVSTVVQNIRDTLGVVFLLGIGAVAIKFLIKAEIVMFVTFLLVGAVVAILVFSPGVVQSVACSIWTGVAAGSGASGCSG